jgi:thioredoxin reductase (NADPH)
MREMYDVIILGAGPTGLAAGIHLALWRLSTLVLEADEKAGGIAVRARGVTNYPGFVRISGLRLMERMTRQAAKVGVEIHTSKEVVGLSLQKKEKVVETRRDTYSCKALILATGDGMRSLGMKGETWIGGGVAYCAECSMPFLKGNDIIVAGSVIEAIEEALYLTKIAKRVRLVNHKNMISIDTQTKERLEREGVELIENFVGERIRGRPPNKRLLLRHVKGSKTKQLKTNIVFMVGGVKPFVSVLRKAGIKMHRLGCVIVDEFGRTNIEGVFAAGGCASTVRDIIPACIGDGTYVATCVHLYLKYAS